MARILLREHARGLPIPRFSAAFPELNEADAARIRQLVRDDRLAVGERLAGARVYRTADGHVWGYLTAGDISHNEREGKPGGIALQLAIGVTEPARHFGALANAAERIISVSAPTGLPRNLARVDAITATCIPPPVGLRDRRADAASAAEELLWLIAELLTAGVRPPPGFWLIA